MLNSTPGAAALISASATDSSSYISGSPPSTRNSRMPLGCVQENTRVLPRLSASDEWRAVTMVINLSMPIPVFSSIRKPFSHDSADCRLGTALLSPAGRAGGLEFVKAQALLVFT